MRSAGVTIVLVLALAAGCGSETATPGVTLSGSLTDPSGDGGVADVVSASVEVAGDDMVLTAEFTPGTFHGDSLLVGVHFDTDENPGTGYTTANPGHAGFGIDCFVVFGKLTGSSSGVRVERFDSGIFIPVAAGTLRLLANGLEATVPADACEDDGPALFKVDAFRQLTAIGFTVRQDWAPDPGQAAATLRPQ